MSQLSKDQLRFLAKVEFTPTCWLWRGSRLPGKWPYGVFSFNSKPIRAHRAAWLLFRGEIPEGTLVCHHCDIPPCVNPLHLFLGDQKDNLADMVKKGRACFGELNGQRKLTAENIRSIRVLASSRQVSQRDLAAQFGVCKETIIRVLHGKTWRHFETDSLAEIDYRKKVNATQVRSIRAQYRHGGISQAQLGRLYGLNQTTVGEIVRGEIWKEVAC